MVCSSPHSHIVCPSSLNPHFCIRDLHLPVPVQRRFRLDQVGHASLEPGGSDSLGLNESLCGVVWRWLDQRFSLRVWALPSRGSTEWRKLCLDFSLFLAGSCSYVTNLDETSHMSAEFVFRYGPKCMGGVILPILVLLHL